MTAAPPPMPLPESWARTVANGIAAELRRGWRIDKATRAISPTGAPTTGRDKLTSSTPKALPNTEVLWSIPYAWGLTDPTPALGVPYLLWHLTQTNLAAALIDAELLEHAETMNTWLRQRPTRGPAPAPFTLRANRHGTLAFRANTEYVPAAVTSVLLAAVTAATIRVPDPRDVNDHLAEWDGMRPSEVLGILSSPSSVAATGAFA